MKKKTIIVTVILLISLISFYFSIDYSYHLFLFSYHIEGKTLGVKSIYHKVHTNFLM